MKDPNEITQKLMEPFPVDVIDEKQGLLYVPAEIVRLRLIDATDNQFDWHLDRTEFRLDGASTRNDRATNDRVEVPVAVAYGHLTIPGLGTRAGVGVQEIQPSGGADSAYKGAESDALKRAAMQFGVGLHQLYIEPGEAKRAQKAGSRRPAQQTTERATSTRPQTRQHGQNGTNERTEMNDAEFDREVTKALAARDATAYRAMVNQAGKYTSRWLVLIHACDSPKALDWIAQQIEDRGMASDLISHELAKRAAEIKAKEGATK